MFHEVKARRERGLVEIGQLCTATIARGSIVQVRVRLTPYPAPAIITSAAMATATTPPRTHPPTRTQHPPRPRTPPHKARRDALPLRTQRHPTPGHHHNPTPTPRVTDAPGFRNVATVVSRGRDSLFGRRRADRVGRQTPRTRPPVVGPRPTPYSPDPWAGRRYWRRPSALCRAEPTRRALLARRALTTTPAPV